MNAQLQNKLLSIQKHSHYQAKHFAFVSSPNFITDHFGRNLGIGRNLNVKYFLIPPVKKFPYLKYFILSALLGGFFFYKDDRRLLNLFSKLWNKLPSFHFQERIKGYCHYILTSDEIKNDGVELLKNIFINSHTKQAVLNLINDTLSNPEFNTQAKIYGVGLFKEILDDKDIRNEVKNLCLQIIQTDEIKLEALQVLKFIIEKEESKEIFSQYLKVIFLRSDIIKSLSNVISDAAIYTMSTDTTKKKFSGFVVDVWSDPTLRWYVIRRALNFWQKTNSTVMNENLTGIRLVASEADQISNVENIPKMNNNI